MCTVDKKVCFRKLINRVIVANGGDEFNQIVALCLFCGTWNGFMISVDNLFTVISFSLSGT